MKSKKGQALIVVVIIVGILVIGGILLFTREAAISEAELITELGTCEVEPYLETTLVDITNLGTAIANAAVNGRVNEVYVGEITTGSSGTVLSMGDEVNMLLNGTNYPTKEGTISITKCGENEISASLCKLDGAPSVTIFNDAGNELTNDWQGGATNQSSSSNPIINDMHFTMPSDECADAVVFVIEASNSTEVDKIQMSTNKGTIEEYKNNQPDIHSVEGAYSDSLFNSFIAKGFANDGGKTIFSITLDPESGETIGAGNSSVFITWYFPQAFIDVDGTIKYDIENVDGTAKHVTAASSDYDYGLGVVG